MIDELRALPRKLGRVERALADRNYVSEKMVHRLKTRRGKKFYALRKQTPECRDHQTVMSLVSFCWLS